MCEAMIKCVFSTIIIYRSSAAFPHTLSVHEITCNTESYFAIYDNTVSCLLYNMTRNLNPIKHLQKAIQYLNWNGIVSTFTIVSVVSVVFSAIFFS